MRTLFIIVMSFGIPLFGLAGCGMFLSAGYGSSAIAAEAGAVQTAAVAETPVG